MVVAQVGATPVNFKIADPVYREFKSRADAVGWFEQYLRRSFPKNIHPPVVLPESDARYARAQNILARLWPGPKAPPWIVAYESPRANGNVIFDKTSGEFPAVVVLTTGALALDFSDVPLAGLIAHEMGHLILGHPLPGRAEQVEKNYWLPDLGGEPLGKDQRNDPRAAQVAKQWKSSSKAVGPYVFDEFDDLPVALF